MQTTTSRSLLLFFILRHCHHQPASEFWIESANFFGVFLNDFDLMVSWRGWVEVEVVWKVKRSGIWIMKQNGIWNIVPWFKTYLLLMIRATPLIFCTVNLLNLNLWPAHRFHFLLCTYRNLSRWVNEKNWENDKLFSCNFPSKTFFTSFLFRCRYRFGCGRICSRLCSFM